jgi:hypothetical protein
LTIRQAAAWAVKSGWWGAVPARSPPPLELSHTGNKIAQFVPVKFGDQGPAEDVSEQIVHDAQKPAKIRLTLAPAEQHAVGVATKATSSRWWLPGCSRIAKTCWDGAILNLSGSVGGTGTPNTPATESARDFSVYRPHVEFLPCLRLLVRPHYFRLATLKQL